MSLYDEYDMLEETAGFSSPQNKPSELVYDSLADELGNALVDESYESDTANFDTKIALTASPRSKPQSSKFDYTGEEWGDPAEDSDPDGRFATLNDSIFALYETMHIDLDSAYISDDMSETSEDAPVPSEAYKTGPSDEFDLFVDNLRALASQGEVEHNSLRLIYANDLAAKSLAKHCSEIREMTRGYLQSFVGLADQDPEIDNVTECLRLLQKSLPSKLISSASSELSLLEAETNALVADLNLLKDSLQECKQTSYQAQRFLKLVKESCSQWTIEASGVEEAQTWLFENDMESKLSERLFSKELANIKSGFEEVCTKLRRQITGEKHAESMS